MRRYGKLTLVALAPLLMAAIWMDEQPTYKPFQAPMPASPAGSVPVDGRESITQESQPKNPVAASPASLALGKELFEINCAMCHGQSTAERGPVGKKLVPPPPALDHDMVQGLSDADIFKALTFGFGRMPRFQEKLTPTERWHLVNFLRTRR